MRRQVVHVRGAVNREGRAPPCPDNRTPFEAAVTARPWANYGSRGAFHEPRKLSQAFPRHGLFGEPGFSQALFVSRDVSRSAKWTHMPEIGYP